MRYEKIVAAALVIGALACPLGSCGTAEGAGTAVHGAQAGTMGYHFHENDGLRLRVPLVYDKLLVASPGEAHKGQLFSLTEKASLDAGLKENAAYTGMGWLFGIGRVTEAELHEMLCGDMSGRELFAKDGVELEKYKVYFRCEQGEPSMRKD